MTPAEIKALLDNVDRLLKSINDHVNQVLGNFLLRLVPGAKDVIQWIHDRVSEVSHTIENVANAVLGTIGNGIQAIVPTAVDFLIGVVNNVFNDVHSILGNLATAEEFVGGAINELARHADVLAPLLLGPIGGGVQFGLMELLKVLEGQDRDTVDHFLNEIMKAKSLPDWLRHMVDGLRGRKAEWQAIALPILVGVLLQPIGEAMVHPLLVELEQQSGSIFKTQVNSPPALVEQRLKNVINHQRFLGEMSYNNLDTQRSDELLQMRYGRLTPEQIATLQFRGQLSPDKAKLEFEEQGIVYPRDIQIPEALRPLLSPDEIRDTYRRGIIDEPKHDALLRQHGFHDDVIARKKSLYWLIPPPQDLIHMAIRNVFSPEIVQRFQLFGDFPPTFELAARQQGISKDWAERYWGAHWIVPSNQEGFDMFHRTTLKSDDEHHDVFTLSDGTTVQNVIGLSTLQLLLREKDTAPYYRKKLTEIAYLPFTRIDVRRMYSVGTLTHAGVERAYLDLGYSPDRARKLADFVKTYYSQASKDKAQVIIAGLRREALRLYVQNKLSRDDIGFVLDDMGFTETETNYFIAEADLVRHAERSKKVETSIGRLYVGRFITEDDTRKRLTSYGIPDEAISTLIDGWNIDIEFKQDTEHFHKQRDLTKAEVTQAFVDGLMNEDDTLTFYEYLGYPEAEAQIELSLAKNRRDKQARTATEDALKALYVNGIQSGSDTSNALDALLVPAQRRDALLAQWKLQRETRTERIPIATLRDMVKGQFLSATDALPHLKRHRFTDDDANLMLDWWTQPTTQGGRRRAP